MITLTDAQRRAMQGVRTDDDRVAFIADHLRAYFPGRFEGIPDESVETRVRSGIARARRYGIESLGDLCSWVTVMFETAARFDEQPELHNILTDPARAPSDRYAALFAGGLAEAWEQAAALSGHFEAELDAWFPETAGVPLGVDLPNAAGASAAEADTGEGTRRVGLGARS